MQWLLCSMTSEELIGWHSSFRDVLLLCPGTSTLLEACLAKGVPRLIFTSTIDVVIGDEDIRGGNETLPVPDKFLFPGYPETKLRAEQLVLNANGASFSSGESRLLLAPLSNCHLLKPTSVVISFLEY